jgi:Mn-dependent DtxR family transcriptional regulator
VKRGGRQARQVMVVKVDVLRLAYTLSRNGRRYLRVKDLSSMLGVSMRTAGKILAAMERLGVASRWSSSAYRIHQAELGGQRIPGNS